MNTVSAEKPLAGAVLCCTSVPPELRTQYAEYAQEMGAEHKLDLTSDVTHLLVGDTDTLKYKYVAREREDVKVLRPEFVQAVRAKWMQAQPFDTEALEAEYYLAPFHNLRICITGFDDMNFRSQLQKNVLENGGQYSGDLTKEVTHLVAARPEGKKYEYATQWQKKVVSLRWYKDTLSRGMQLDESLYHPSKPIDEQGTGAWNHKPDPQSQLGKRPREEHAATAPRKLRRTASSRLSSQNDNMWTDIVGGGAFNIDEVEKPTLRPAKSMPALNSNLHAQQTGTNDLAAPRHGYFYGKQFAIRRFDSAKEEKLRSIVTGNGGTLIEATEDIQSLEATDIEATLLLVPWQTPLEMVQSSEKLHVITELWIEYCMERRSYIPPSEYPFGSLRPRAKPPGFSNLTVASNGFPGIQLLHVSKVIGAMGAKYSEIFNETVSVLVCRSGPDNPQRKQKLQRAQSWGIPVVSEKWLYSCLQNNRKQPFEAHLLQRPRALPSPADHDNPEKPDREAPEVTRGPVREAEHVPKVMARTVQEATLERHSHMRNLQKQQPGSDFWSDSRKAPSPTKAPEKSDMGTAPSGNNAGPLQEISPNSPTKRSAPADAPKPKKALFRTFDGSSSSADENQPLPAPAPANQDTRSITSISNVSDARSLNGDIQDLLNIKAKAKAAADASSSKSKKLVGRALSNLSNASATSQRKLSRASSVDSMNTDGIGSEIGPVSGKSQEGNAPRSFTGRAKSRLLDGVSNSIELCNPALSIEDLPQKEDLTPALTQLVYDDPEEAIMLREKLAARRRARSKLGQKEDDPKPEKPREQRRIKDDDLLTNAGWASGGRTRRGGKVPTPEGLKDF